METVRLVDSSVFVVNLKAAEQAIPNSDKRAALLAEAIALYQGPLLDGFYIRDGGAFEDWLHTEREHFQRLALQALNELVAHYAHHGELLASIQYASQLLGLDPLREEIHRHLMLLFALDGQPSAALAQYRSCQQILRQEVGIEPSTETHQLFERIRAGEFNKNAPSPVPLAASVPQVVPPPVRHNLPAQFSTFVGRTEELQQLQRQLQDPACRLLTITGFGGVGKTRLALATAQALADSTPAPFPAGVWFVTLPGLEAIDQVENRLTTAIAENLQIPLTGSAPTTQLIQALYDKALLLVLDNFEPHAAAISWLVALLHGTRKLNLLVTARTRLNIGGEQVMSLQGLPSPPTAVLAHPDGAMTSAHSATERIVTEPIAEVLNSYAATQLFVLRARTVATHFTLDAATGIAIVQICHLVQGLPLGIELAATWVRLLRCAEIAAEIGHNIDFLENSQADAPLQQRSLRAVFHASWRLLSPAEQACLRQLALLRGGFTRTAAAALAGATLPLLARLVDTSFVQRSAPMTGESVGDDAGGAVRYELPEVIRQFAAEQLVQAGEQALVAARHADYYTRLLATQRPKLQGAGQSEALRIIGSEIENMRTAWRWSSDHLLEGGLTQLDQSLDALFYFYDMRSWFQEGATIFAQTTAQVALYRATTNEETSASILWAKLQARHGWFAFHLGRPLESRILLEESLTHLRRLASTESVFNLNYLGAILRHLGEFTAAQSYTQEALTLAQAHNDPMGASIALNILGQLASLQGNTEHARAFLRQALSLKRQLGDRWGLTYSLTYLGRVAQETGDYAAAQKLFDESLLIYQAIGDQRGMAFALQNLADTTYAAGQISAAQAHYRESLRIYRDIGQRAEASLTLSRLGEATCAAGNTALAAQQLDEALAMAWSVQATPSLLAATVGLAALAIATGQPEQAVQPLHLVYHHPASTQTQKQKVQQQLAALGTDVTVATATSDLNQIALKLELYVQARLEDA